MQRITALLACLFCAAAQAQSIDIESRSERTVSIHRAVRRAPPDEVSAPASTPRQPCVTPLIESLCVSSPVPAPPVPWQLYDCLLSGGAPASPRAANADIRVLAVDCRAPLADPTLASDSPASGPVLWLRADVGVRSTAGKVSAWQDLRV